MAPGGLERFLQAVTLVELLVCLAVAGVLGIRWSRHRSQAMSSALALFGCVALVLAGTLLAPADPTRGWGVVYTAVLISTLLSVPYLLVRFTWSLGGLGDRAHRFAGAVLVLEVAATLALLPFDPEAVDPPSSYLAYMAFVLGAWVAQSLLAAVGLWQAGRGGSSVVRHRMRSLSAGAALLAVTLVLGAVAGAAAPASVRVGVALLGLVAVTLFALAFLLPPSLRLVWRQADVTALSAAERGLMTALTRDDVAGTIVPVLGAVFGGGGAALLDGRGAPLRATGLAADEIADLGELLRARPPSSGVQVVANGVLAAELADGWLVVQAGRLSPVFGDDEAVLLSRVSTLVDLALQRVRLFEQERTSREAAEAAGADLETLLYSVSHDLRSPLISVLGYLDVLRAEHGAGLTGDGAHYLERISVNAVYMQSLISDLLELSRIGRSDPPARELDLQALADQVVEAARLGRPAADVRVEGRLPAIRMTDVRARQLLTNLVDNALSHGGRDDLVVTVSAVDGPDHGLVLRVADDGRGIPAEYRTRVLRVFERLDAPKSSPGTGMGLAICKRIVESVGGVLALEGPPPGAATGTTVTVSLPAAVRASTDPRTTDPRTTDPRTTDPRTTDPRTTDPRTTDPRTTDPRTTDTEELV